MIYILSGVPRSGKTYYAVHKILSLLSDLDLKILILHNIEGLNVDDNRLIRCDWNPDNVLADFNNDAMALFLSNLRSERGLSPSDEIYIFIDEAQRFFPTEFKLQPVVFFFDYHGHYGVHIYLITQHEKKICFRISSLIESEFRAVNGRVNFSPRFTYREQIAGEEIARVRLKKEDRVFKAYKSFRAGTGKVKRSPLGIKLTIAFVLFFLIMFMFFKLFRSSFVKDDVAFADNATHIQPTSTATQVSQTARKFDQKPFESKNDLHSRGNSTLTVEPDYIAPKIVSYNNSTDTVSFYSDDVLVRQTVSKYVETYSPEIYGYGYVHSRLKNKFIVFSRLHNKIYFPAENTVAKVQHLNRRTVETVSLVADIPYPRSKDIDSPDLNGFTDRDKVMMEYFRLKSMGYDVSLPDWFQKNQQSQQLQAKNSIEPAILQTPLVPK